MEFWEINSTADDDVLVQMICLLNLRNWTRWKNSMCDEARQQDHYWASLTYAQEEGRARGMRLRD